MFAARVFVAAIAVFAFTAAGFAQAPKADPKKEKGQLPPYWKMLGLTDKQIQEVYKIQGKYNDEIDTLEAKIKELKDKMSKERSEVLTAEQKKRLEEILKDKAGTGDKKDK